MTIDSELIEEASSRAPASAAKELLRLAGFRDTEVQSCKPLAGGNPEMSQVFRVWVDGSDRFPPTVVMKLPAKDPAHRKLQANNGSYARELNVYGILRNLQGSFQPRLWSHIYDDDSRTAALLIEDLGKLPKRSEFNIQIMQEIMSNLAGIHSSFWEQNQLGSQWWMRNEPHADIFNEDTDQFAPNWEILTASKELHPYDQPYVNQVGRFVAANLLEILGELDHRPRTLTHGDLHTENMMLRSSEGIAEPVLIDWQDAVFSGASSDVAKFLSTTLTPEDPADSFQALISRYHTCLSAEVQAEYPLDFYRRDIMLALLGTFANYVIAATTELSDAREPGTINSSLKRVSAVINVVQPLHTLAG